RRPPCPDEPTPPAHPHHPGPYPPSPFHVCEKCAALEPYGSGQPTVKERIEGHATLPSAQPNQPYVDNPINFRALLCDQCEKDEQTLYQHRVGTRAVGPRGATGWPANTCVCVFNVMNRGYCMRCKQDAILQAIRVRDGNEEWLKNTVLGRDALYTASQELRRRRAAAGIERACRCGRDTQPPSQQPAVAMCLCCEGVIVDVNVAHGRRSLRPRKVVKMGRTRSETRRLRGETAAFLAASWGSGWAPSPPRRAPLTPAQSVAEQALLAASPRPPHRVTFAAIEAQTRRNALTVGVVNGNRRLRRRATREKAWIGSGL
ncbi:hypothetical protein LTR39_001658, partial [Cryomyces antarcticus]